MIGQIPVIRPTNRPFSENITRKGLYCSSTIYNFSIFIQNTSNTIHQLLTKICQMAFEIFKTLILLTAPLIKYAIYLGLTEAAVSYFPKESNAKIAAGLSHTAYLTNLIVNAYRSKIYTTASILASVVLISFKIRLHLNDVRMQWQYPLGFKNLPKGTEDLYQWMAKCTSQEPAALELWRRVPDFDFRVIKENEKDGWDPDLNEIKVDATQPMTVRFDRFTYDLSLAAKEFKVKELFKQLRQGLVSLREFIDRYIAVYYEIDVDHIDIVHKCMKIIDLKGVKSHYTLFGKRSDNIDGRSKDVIDEVIKDTRKNQPARIKSITKIWNENNERYCNENKDPDCNSPMRFTPKKWAPKATSHFIRKCRKRIDNIISTVIIPKKILKSPKERIHELTTGAFEGNPKLGALFGSCPQAYELWEKVSQTKSVRDLVQYILNVRGNPTTQQQLYESFGGLVEYLMVANVRLQRNANLEELKKGEISKNEFILKDIEFQWNCREDQKRILLQCHELFNKNAAKKFHLNIKLSQSGNFKKYFDVSKKDGKQYYDQKWRENGYKPWCGNNPWRKGCATDNRPSWNAFLHIARKNLYMPTCSKSTLKHIRELVKKEK